MMALTRQNVAAAAVLLGLTLLGPAPSTLWAQSRAKGEPSETQTVETRAVTVTATRTEKDLMEVPMSVGVKTEEDLKREPTTSVADLLADIPGVTVMDQSIAGLKRVIIRGEAPSRSMILIDGVRTSEQKSMDGAAIMIDTSQIERIEVIKGPASALYGSEAIGGVINIITKKGGKKPIGFSLNTVVDSSTTSADMTGAVFGNINGFNYRFSANGINADDRKTPSGKAANTSYDIRQYAGQVGYDWAGGSAFFRAEKFEGVFTLPGDHSDPDASIDMGLPKWDRETLSAGLELNDLGPYLTKVKANAYSQNLKKDFWNKIRTNIIMPSVSPLSRFNPYYAYVDIDTANDQDSYGGSLQSEWTLGAAHYLIFGADYNLDDLAAATGTRTITKMPSSPMRPAYGDTYTLFNHQAEQNQFSLFLQDEWKMVDDLALTVGLRQTWIDSEFTTTDDPQLRSYLGSTRDSNLVGSVGLVYSGLENLALRAQWSQGYRYPMLNQLYLGTTHGSTMSTPTLSNPDLKPETSDNYEIGARYSDGIWNLDTAVFYNDAKNYITTRSMGAYNMFINANQAETYGLEVGLSRTFESWNLTPYTTATWIHRAFTDDRGHKTSRTGLPDFNGRVGLKWQREFDNAHTLFTDLYVDWATKAQDEFYENAAYQQTEYAAWQTLNLTIGTEWGEDHKWNASLSLRNIGDQDYTQANNMVADPGFHVVLGVGFEY